MELKDIASHWQNWAQQYSIDLRATTKTSTIKQLEINALHQAILKTPLASAEHFDALEVGCGNGYNCFGLSSLLPKAHITGVDFIPDMINNANTLLENAPDTHNLSFLTGDILELNTHENLKSEYDVVFTDRCIINLNSAELHEQALDQLAAKTKKNGYILLIENVIENYQSQNTLRESVGLPSRVHDKFNTFLEESRFLKHTEQHLDLIETVDFASLHDLVLYVLVPSINEGKVDYDHPMVSAITELLLANTPDIKAASAPFGQNRLYVFQKRG